MMDFLQKRKSVRNFKSAGVPKEELEKIRTHCKELEKEIGDVKFIIVENGEIVQKALKGKAGYSGVMIDAPHYLGLGIDKDDNRTMLAIGYIIEKINTMIVEEGYDTCWITIDRVDENTRKDVFGEIGSSLKYLIAIGQGKEKKFFEIEKASVRYPLNEIVYKDDLSNPVTIDYLEERGLLDILYSIRYAPSHKNLQPWRFVISGSDVVLYMKKSSEDFENKRSLVDMGVVMMYFEEMAKSYNINNKWEVVMEDEGEYLKIGKFTM